MILADGSDQPEGKLRAECKRRGQLLELGGPVLKFMATPIAGFRVSPIHQISLDFTRKSLPQFSPYNSASPSPWSPTSQPEFPSAKTRQHPGPVGLQVELSSALRDFPWLCSLSQPGRISPVLGSHWGWKRKSGKMETHLPWPVWPVSQLMLKDPWAGQDRE